MSVRQHLCALAHWMSPWDSETRENVAIASVLYTGILLVALALRNWNMTVDLLGVYWWFARLFLLLHGLSIVAYVLILRIRNGKSVWHDLRLAWREAGNEVLFLRLRREMANRRYERRTEARIKNLLSDG